MYVNCSLNNKAGTVTSTVKVYDSVVGVEQV